MQIEITKNCLSDWAKEVKKKMIDMDMDVKDVAAKFKWTSAYFNSLLRGTTYSQHNVEIVSLYFGVIAPRSPEETKLHKRTYMVEI